MVRHVRDGSTHAMVVGLRPPCEGMVEAVAVGGHLYDWSRVGGFANAGASEGVWPGRSPQMSLALPLLRGPMSRVQGPGAKAGLPGLVSGGAAGWTMG